MRRRHSLRLPEQTCRTLELEAAQVVAKSGLEVRVDASTPAGRRQLVEEMMARSDLSKPLRAALESRRSGGVSAASLPPMTKIDRPSPPSPAEKEMQRHFLALALKPKNSRPALQTVANLCL